MMVHKRLTCRLWDVTRLLIARCFLHRLLVENLFLSHTNEVVITRESTEHETGRKIRRKKIDAIENIGSVQRRPL